VAVSAITGRAARHRTRARISVFFILDSLFYFRRFLGADYLNILSITGAI
jgi:hypothetical protein